MGTKDDRVERRERGIMKGGGGEGRRGGRRELQSVCLVREKGALGGVGTSPA